MAFRELAASTGQRLLWYLDHYRGADGALNCPVVCWLRGPLDVVALQDGLDQLTRRHEALRTTFERRGRQILQLVHDASRTPFELVDLSGNADPISSAQAALTADLGRRIDASVWPVRATLWKVDDREHLLSLNMHHLVSDGTSGSLLFRDLRLLGARQPLPAITWQYPQFTEWQQSIAQSGGLRAHDEYWRRRLYGLVMPEIPLRGAGGGEPRETARQSVELSQETAERLRSLARAQRTTLFSVMLACYYLLLNRSTGGTDLAVASVFANRTRAETQNTVGFLANTVVLRTTIDPLAPIASAIRATHATVMDAFVHQLVPYHTLPLDLVHSGTRRADDLVFQMIADPMDRSGLLGTDAELVVPEAIGTRFELELSVIVKDRKLSVVLFYNAMRVDSSWAREFIAGFVSVATTVANQWQPARA